MSEGKKGPICPTCYQAWPQQPSPDAPAQRRGFRDEYPYPGPFPGLVWGTLEDSVRSMGQLRGRPLHEIVGRIGAPTRETRDGELRLLEWIRAGNYGSFTLALVFDSTDTCGNVVERTEESTDAAFYEALLARPTRGAQPAPPVQWNVGVWFPVDI